MGQILNCVPNAVNTFSTDAHHTVTELINTIHALRGDASGTIHRITHQLIETLRIITGETQQTTALLRHGFLAMMAIVGLSLLLFLTNFSPFLRFLVWLMFATLCLHMLMTYVRYSHRRISSNFELNVPIEYRNDRLETKIMQSKTRTDIDLLGQKLNDDDMNIIVSHAICEQRCVILRLGYNQFTSIGASILSDALMNNQTLERLSLWNNSIGDKGVQFLSTVLSANRSILKDLDLSENEITDHGAEYLSQMLRTNTILTRLSLSNNRITDCGLEHLTNALKTRNKTLQSLSLTQNKFVTDKSITYVIRIFENNQTLEKLWIDDCNLSKIGCDQLRRAKRKDFELHI